MAFSASGLNCIAVGPTKVYVYNTSDTLDSATIKTETTGLCSNNCPGMSAGDIIMLAHAGNSSLDLIRITAITATTCTYTSQASLS